MSLNRRDFVAATGIATAAVATGMLSTCACESAEAQTTQPSTQPGNLIDVGDKSTFSADGPTMTWAKSKHIIPMHQDGKLYVMSSRCTHRRCILTNDKTKNDLLCRCHHSEFKYDGTVIDGPAKLPLIRYGVALDDGGHVQVNMHKQFMQDQWDDPASFIPLPSAQT